jgi:hypothetical protein
MSCSASALSLAPVSPGTAETARPDERRVEAARFLSALVDAQVVIEKVGDTRASADDRTLQGTTFALEALVGEWDGVIRGQRPDVMGEPRHCGRKKVKCDFPLSQPSGNSQWSRPRSAAGRDKEPTA